MMNARSMVVLLVASAAVAGPPDAGMSLDAGVRFDAGISLDAGAVLSPTELFAQTSPSVVVIRAGDRLGSGVVVGKGLVVTNAHVLNGATSCAVTLQGRVESATVRASSAAHDLALLSLDTRDARPVALRRSTALVVGERVYAIGSPRGFEQTLSEGLVSGLRPEGGVRIVQTSAPISPGSSGGGLFDATGRLVGITTWQRLDGQNLNFANPVEWVEELLTAPPAKRATTPAARMQRVVSTGIAPALLNQLRALAEKGQFVSHVAFTPAGGWVVTWGRNEFEAVDVPARFLTAYKAAAAQGRTLRGPSFSSQGWAFFTDTSGFTAEGVSPALVEALTQANARGERLTSVAMTAGSSVLISGTNAWWGAGMTDGLQRAIRAANDSKETIDLLAMRPDGAWVMLRKGGTAWTFSTPAPTGLIEALDQEWKEGRAITHVALAPTGGWVLLSL